MRNVPQINVKPALLPVCRVASETEMGGEEVKAAGLVLELPVNDPSFDLAKAVCSHGLFMMAPNQWNPTTKTLQRPLRLSSSSLTVRISQPSPSHPLLLVSVFGADSLASQDQQSLLDQVRRMLRISDETDRVIRKFHQVHEASKERGFGRVFRCPTLFEDMVKCILLCNCQWSRTLAMARALCELQLDRKFCSAVEDFQPKTPQPIELKGKSKKRKKIVARLETKFEDNLLSENASSVLDNEAQHEHPQGSKLASTVLSCIKSSQDSSHPAQPPNAELNDSSTLFNEIGPFPTPQELADLDSDFLAKRCNLGYRAQRIISLAKSIADGKLQLEKLEQVCDGYLPSSYEEIDKQLSGINGFGPFTRANVLMCMDFYDRIPVDSETVRHLKMFHKRRCTVKSVEKDVEAIYGKYVPFQFLAYWSELWDDYERRFGKLSEMPSSNYQLITASNMKHKLS